MVRSYVCLLLSYLAGISLVSCGGSHGEIQQIFTVNRGPFLHTITVTGELEAVHSLVIYAPNIGWNFGLPKISQLVDDGQQVQKDDVLATFDSAEIERAIVEAKSELEIATAELQKAIAQQEAELADLKADLEIAQYGQRISQLKLEQATYEAEIERKEIELDLEKSVINLEKAQQEIVDKQKVHDEGRKKLELKVQQAQMKLQQAEETLASLTVTAPAPGIAIIRKNWSTGNKIQVDDQPWPGMALLGLPDLDSMEARVEINEVDIAKINITQTATIRLDAYPDTQFTGFITDIATLARNKSRESKVKVFDVTIRLNERDDILMPGMTVRCEILVERIDDVLYIPLESLFQEDGKNYVYLKKRGGFEPQKVETGAENDNYVIITDGLDEEDTVALYDPTRERFSGSKKENETSGAGS